MQKHVEVWKLKQIHVFAKGSSQNLASNIKRIN